MNQLIKRILNEVRQGIFALTLNNIQMINEYVTSLLKSNDVTSELENIRDILEISNILYNNTDKHILLLEDGVYDLLLELYKKYDSNYQVGAQPVYFKPTNQIEDNVKSKVIQFVDEDKINNMLYVTDLFKHKSLTRKDILKSPIKFINNETVSKRVINTKHNYPKLVGTLDKCKFVLNAQAIEKGVYNDSNVKILERDFFKEHIEKGILDSNRKFYMVAELKYDGVSIEADVTTEVLGARSRGDANQDIAADLTPILRGYRFKHAVPIEKSFGMKFEAIMTYANLARYNQAKGKNYKNCRTAISGLFASADAPQYRDYITLVPLATSLEDVDRLTEIEFMNKYYDSGERLRYSVLYGTYIEILFQIKMFVEEAEYLRQYMPFMYDGVVVSYIEPDLIDKLGRVNSVNKYSMAIKFNPIKKQAIFTGYKYTVGQDGTVTPMIYYTPVEFYGTTHNKSSGHSYERFKTLELRIGDILDVEYVNDVMPYVSKPDNSHNLNNPNPVEKFIEECPSCGTKLVESESGKSIKCPNLNCKDRNLARIVSMLDKLNIKDFSDAYLSQIDKYTLTEMMNLSVDDIKFLGDITSQKFIENMNKLKSEPIYDYKIIGSLGFTGIAIEKWKLILTKYTIHEILSFNEEQLRNALLEIKGIGPTTVNTIVTEFNFFRKDIETISKMSNIIPSKGASFGKSIRFTGFRDEELVEKLNAMGHDASGIAGLTKATDILLIPYEGFTSSKTAKAAKNGTQIVAVQQFKDNINKYL